MLWIRHLVAILVLPFVMVVYIPHWLQGGAFGLTTRWHSEGARIAGESIGGLMFLAGFALFAWCLYSFATRGQGTLAPWDPPKHLVIVGPYRYMRNPMITGVLMMLAGEALYHGSLVLAVWVLVFFVFNQIHFVLIEEPGLAKRFGDEYSEYKRTVGRWIPTRTKPAE